MQTPDLTSRVRRLPSRDRRDPSSLLSTIQPPFPLRWMSGALVVLIPLLALLLMLTPWQQAAPGSGKVIAFNPAERQQVIDARIDARLVAWHVQEGQSVSAGDLLATLQDNDPDLRDNLLATLTAAQEGENASEAQIRSYEARLVAAEAQIDMVVAEYNRKIASLRRKQLGEEATRDAEALNLDRQETLAGEGISSQRTLDVARMKEAKAEAALGALEQEIAATVQARNKAQAQAQAKAASAQADLDAARAKLAESTQKRISATVKLTQQGAQEVFAVQDGTVLKVYGGPGTWKKKGDPLVALVPQTTSRAVELYIDGNDTPLVRPGESVRVVFEGWPALQFVGLKGFTSPGTFPGEVALVDATDNGSGKFRIVVKPTDEQSWPDAEVLRQGTRAKGWVLLGQVSLGYELWRQVNGFPALPSTDKGTKPTIPSNKKPRAPASLD
ncbi:MAG: adhesin transport system membrane fusion protein [Myxococcota bacterium]|jgi:adhesin transport system membrane fusion protein